MIRLSGNFYARWLVGCLAVVFAAFVPPSEAGIDRSEAGCMEVVVIDLHGSGAGPNESSATGAFMTEKLRKLLKGRSLKFETVPFSAAGGFPALLGGALKLPAAYHKSVTKTKDWLRRRLNTLADTCKDTSVFLTGYSQGAQVAGDVYQEGVWTQVVGVALFGDPYYNHADKSNRFGLNIKDKRQRIKSTLKGALAAPEPRPAFNSDRVFSFCHQFDPVCQAPLSRYEQLRYRTSQHKNYADFGEPEAAAAHFSKLWKGKTPKSPTSSGWPTKSRDGSPAFMMYLGASFIFPEWSSCSPNYCIVGSGNTVYIFSLVSGIKELNPPARISDNPRGVLHERGVPDEDITELLKG